MNDKVPLFKVCRGMAKVPITVTKHWRISVGAAAQRLRKLVKAGHLKKAGWGLFALA